MVQLWLSLLLLVLWFVSLFAGVFVGVVAVVGFVVFVPLRLFSVFYVAVAACVVWTVVS